MKKVKKENLGDIVLSVLKEQFAEVADIDVEEVTKRISSILINLIAHYAQNKLHATQIHIELIDCQFRHMDEIFNRKNKGKEKTVKTKSKKRQLKK